MKIVKLFDDYLDMNAAQQNMSREEYSAFYMSEKSIIEEEERDTLTELNNMTLGQLERIEDYAEMIGDRMKDGQKLESWMFSQITGAVDNLNSVHDAMDGVDGVKEKKITIDWEDDENAFIFSDAGMVKVDYDGGFKYRGKWFDTAEHTGPEDLLKDLNKTFKSDTFVYISESYKLIKEATDKPSLDSSTGLIYYFDIPFTSEDMEELLNASKAILNAKFTPNKQFEIQPMIFIKDKVNGGEHTFSVAQIGILGAFYDKNKNSVASRKDF